MSEQGRRRAVSARVRPADRAVGPEAGAVDHVIKPFETAELLARVRLVLRAHGTA
jgi:DNA-binding response OmpR family regulator